MKKRIATFYLIIFGLILVHSAFPHTHGTEALSNVPVLNALTVNSFSFLQIDLGEDHLKSFEQVSWEYIYESTESGRLIYQLVIDRILTFNETCRYKSDHYFEHDRGPPQG